MSIIIIIITIIIITKIANSKTIRVAILRVAIFFLRALSTKPRIRTLSAGLAFADFPLVFRISLLGAAERNCFCNGLCFLVVAVKWLPR